MEDSKIIEMLFARDEQALSTLSQKYSRLYLSMIREILSDEGDINECANDCLLAVWNSIPPNRPNNLPAYLCKIARRISINKLRYNKRQKRSDGYTLMLSELEGCIPDSDGTKELHDGEISEHFKKILEDFISSLDARTRILFVRRYMFFESVSSLADRFEMSENLVSVRLYRAKKEFKKILEKEGFYYEK